MGEIDLAKDAIRSRVWTELEHAHAAPAGVRGHIPAFINRDQAAAQLRKLPEWHAAMVVKANPDRAQVAVRTNALVDGKLLYIAVPALASDRPFYVLNPHELPVAATDAARSAVARDIARTVDVEQMQQIDMVVCGSVAVSRDGARLGKGAGYSDIEVGLLLDAGLVGPWTTIVTTVHQLQVLDAPLPESKHDFRVDIIATPNEVIRCSSPHRPSGLVWDDLTRDKIAAIPALARRDAHRASA